MTVTLTDAEATVYQMRKRMRPKTIAKKLGVSPATVRIHLWRAEKRLRGELRSSQRHGAVKKHTRDAGWHDRQVAYLRTLTEEHANRYLNGIQLVWGLEVRNEVEADLARKLPCRV